MSRFTDVLDAAREGNAPAVIAARLGMSRSMVDTMLSQGERLGRLDVIRITGCSDGSACNPADTPTCAACPIRPMQRKVPVRAS